ncbi:mitochondrial substrate carrier family protein [Tasmannia lanceolata]|uniref:mitochondrial substrate carrier family protein n=1 Tax=Tasmannia lanceolata TaxID=3420 RepID=UPI004063E167
MEELLNHHMFATHAIAAAGSVALGTALTHPLDSLKTLIQVGSGSSQQLVAAQVLDRVRSVSGSFGLYSGLGWSIFGRISGLGVRFGIYELLTAFYKDGRNEDYVHVSEALLAGIAAGALEALVSTPFEFCKLRAQVASASHLPTSSTVKEILGTSPIMSKLQRGYAPDTKAWENTVGLLSTLSNKNSKIVGALKEYPWMMTGSGRTPFIYEVKGPLNIISLEGWHALWRGLRAGIVRDCIFGGVFFSSWQFLHIAMLDWKAIDMDPQPSSAEEIGPVSPLAASIAAGFSGSIAAAASHGFDTAKSRSQCIVMPKYISMERRLLRWKPPGFWLERVAGISPSDRNILFRGISLRMARCGLASFTIVGSYFLALDHLL